MQNNLTKAEMLARYKRIIANNSKAGKASAAKLTAEQRHERAMKAAEASRLKRAERKAK